MSELPALDDRDGLPEALRVLLEEFPRASWERDPNFGALLRFWLDRHLMFRRIGAALSEDGARFLDREIAPEAYAARLGRLGNMLVSELHGHHQIEDLHYFPLLARTEPRLERGFDMLERDHLALDRHLADFTDSANGLIRLIGAGEAAIDAGAGFLTHLAGLDRLLTRHLDDEEDLVVPVILKHGERQLG